MIQAEVQHLEGCNHGSQGAWINWEPAKGKDHVARTLEHGALSYLFPAPINEWHSAKINKHVQVGNEGGPTVQVIRREREAFGHLHWLGARLHLARGDTDGITTRFWEHRLTSWSRRDRKSNRHLQNQPAPSRHGEKPPPSKKTKPNLPQLAP